MFTPTTNRIAELSKLFPDVIQQLEQMLSGDVIVYIDYWNVIHWKNRLGWHIEEKRLKQFLKSFSTVKEIKLYSGTLMGDANSVKWVKDIQTMGGYTLKTKPVKVMHFSIDTSSISMNSPALLERFIHKSLLKKLDLKTVELLNQKLQDLNKQGILSIERRKCNFDVEIGRDMFLDFSQGRADNFVLWSGDSDFADPVHQLLNDKKRVSIFATVREVSPELSTTKAPIFEIKKIKEFICRWKEVPQSIKDKLPVP